MVVAEQSVIEGWKGVLVASGLQYPSQRAITALLAAGAVSYAMKMPSRSFREDGSIRPMGGSADATDCHFFLCPAVIGTVVFFLT